MDMDSSCSRAGWRRGVKGKRILDLGMNQKWRSDGREKDECKMIPRFSGLGDWLDDNIMN